MGLESDETLKQSFKDTISEINILEENAEPINFIIKYIQNILKNIFESYTFEDASQNIENFNDKMADEDFSNYIVGSTSNSLRVCLNNSFIENIDDDGLTINNLNKAYSLAMQALKG